MTDRDENLYEILGVRTGSGPDVIRRAWKLAAWENHPDLQGLELDDDARRRNEERMQRINEAYQVLSDPTRRRRYDLEQGLIPATCGRCGKPGSQRLNAQGNAVPLCATCWGSNHRVIAL